MIEISSIQQYQIILDQDSIIDFQNAAIKWWEYRNKAGYKQIPKNTASFLDQLFESYKPVNNKPNIENYD